MHRKNNLRKHKNLIILTSANGGHFKRKSDEINEKGRAFFQNADSDKHLSISKNSNKDTLK